MGDLVWDERLMSREEFWKLAAPLQLRPGTRQGLMFLDCAACGQAVLPLGTVRKPWIASVEQIAAAVLRHQVAAHNMPLNHRRGKEADGDQRAASTGPAQPGGAVRRGPGVDAPTGGRGGTPRRSGAGAAGRRPAAETAGSRREPGATGGDRA